MAFGKSEAEKAAEAQRRVAENHARSPIGLAEDAYRRGDAFYQIQVEISLIGGGSRPGGAWGKASGLGTSSNTVTHTGGKPDLLGQIEEVGWRLEHVGYVFVETGATTSNRIGGTGQGVVTRGEVMGIYLFRRSPPST